MKKEEIDRRVQRTRKVLQDALIELIVEKGFDKVTVQDVIQRANVGRSTFYSHFKDTEDLFLSGFENLWSLFEFHLTSQPDKKIDLWGLSLTMFQHAKSYIGVYKAVVGKHGGNLMSAHLNKYLSAVIRETLQPQFAENTKIPFGILVHHITSSLITLLIWWIEHDLAYSPEKMNEIFRQLTEPTLQSIAGDKLRK